jgi:endonuclease G
LKRFRALCSLVFLFVSLSVYSKGHFLPDCQNFELVEHAFYDVCYNEAHEQANWTYHELTTDMLGHRRERTNNYRFDPDVSTGSVGGRSYRRSGYDRGHLVPAADMKITYQAMSESFFMSNMSPQVHNFNAGIWAYLEGRVRGWAKQKGHIMIVTGPILKAGLRKIGPGVSVPEEYFKIVLHYNFDQPTLSEMIAFKMKNRKTNQNLKAFATTVDHLENVTGFDFFEQLPNYLEERLESQVRLSDWSL